MNTDCELEVEQDKRENSWTIPSPEGRNQMGLWCVCGTQRERHRVCMGMHATNT